MTPFTREKALTQSFDAVSVDENDLVQIANLVKRTSDEYGGKPLTITVVSGDGEDTYRTSDIDFLMSKEMPSEIRSVSISYRDFESPVEISVTIATPLAFPSGASVKAEGTDVTRVGGVFREIVRLLDSRRPGYEGILRFSETWFFFLLSNLIIAAAIFSLFDVVLDLLTSNVQGFRESSLHRLLQYLGVGVTGIGFAVGGLWAERIAKAAFPAVVFRGRLTYPGARRRSRAGWVLVAVMIPILVEVLGSFIQDLVRFMFQR